jgi:hypothetical protein
MNHAYFIIFYLRNEVLRPVLLFEMNCIVSVASANTQDDEWLRWGV